MGPLLIGKWLLLAVGQESVTGTDDFETSYTLRTEGLIGGLANWHFFHSLGKKTMINSFSRIESFIYQSGFRSTGELGWSYGDFPPSTFPPTHTQPPTLPTSSTTVAQLFLPVCPR